MKIGIDIVSIKRIESIIKRFGDKFLKKVFSAKEIREIDSLKNIERKIEKIAGKFAAKEAIIKVLEKPVSLSNIEILTRTNGEPFVNNLTHSIKISISHEKEYAIAVALLICCYSDAE